MRRSSRIPLIKGAIFVVEGFGGKMRPPRSLNVVRTVLVSDKEKQFAGNHVSFHLFMASLRFPQPHFEHEKPVYGHQRQDPEIQGPLAQEKL